MSTGMFTFQGDYKRRAQVNLGRTKHEDRAGLLKKAQEERKAREEKRRREIAAIKIQVSTLLHSGSIISDLKGFWRGRKEVALTKDTIRKEWDVLVSEGGGLVSTWFKATRLFPFFYDKEHDEARAIQLLRWLVRSKNDVNIWLRNDPNFPMVLIRLMALLLKSVGSIKFHSEYV